MIPHIAKDITLIELEKLANSWCIAQRDCNWRIGDIARKAESMGEKELFQVFPEWFSPDHIARCKAVALAYPTESDRQIQATWTQYMRLANDPNRKEKLKAIVNEGLTSDESRQVAQEERNRWLLAVDVNYHLHRNWYSGAGVGAAKQVTDWIGRTVERLREKGLTDVVCCFDSQRNFRKELTSDWEDKYKDRPVKELELEQQIELVSALLIKAGYQCTAVDGFEADDVIASYVEQFDGKTTILSQDKDLRQCLGNTCNILLDVEWIEDELSGDATPQYKWMSGPMLFNDTGLTPQQWTDYQAIAGDNVDGIKGAPGIGDKGAKDLLKQYGTIEAVIEAARDEAEEIAPKKREALIQLSERLDIVRQLVTMRTDLEVPMSTRLA